MKKIPFLICFIFLLSFQTLADVNYFFDGFTRENGTWVGKESPTDWWANMKWLFSEWGSSDKINECYDNLWHVQPGYNEWNWILIRPANVDLNECAFGINDETGLTSRIDMYEWNIFDYTNTSSDTSPMDAHFMSAILNVPVSGNPSDILSTGLILNAELDINTNTEINLAIFLNRKDFTNTAGGTILFYTNVSFVVGNTLALNFNTNSATVNYGSDVLFTLEHGLENVNSQKWYAGYCVQNVEKARAEYYFDNAEIIGTGAGYGDYLENSFTGSDGDSPDSNVWFLTTYSPSKIQNNMCKMHPTNISWQGTMLGYKSDIDNSLRFDPEISELDISLRIMNVDIIETGSWDATTIFKTEYFPERSRVKSYDYNSTNLSIEALISIAGSGGTQINFAAMWYSKKASQNTFFRTNLWFVPGATCVYHLTQTDFSIDYGEFQGTLTPHSLDIPAVFPRGIFVTHRTENGSDGRAVVYIDDVVAQAIPEPFCLLFISQLIFITYLRRHK